ncbi:hypothetical protein AB0I22_06790 [Streptomyces sp. NPDC050610]|uniref:hypothetical protein n=1 Tax=Streptomyces sp. NPDC050610 TaxID=3157097 RepID=UPI00341E3EDA
MADSQKAPAVTDHILGEVLDNVKRDPVEISAGIAARVRAASADGAEVVMMGGWTD